jgi:glycosyltransferase involved in cell wall biosynthesis
MKSSGPDVAIIIPCHNHGRYLGECLGSVMGQTLAAAEVVVVDDGSTDNTAEVCSQFPDVLYLHQETKGVSSARNLGLRHTTSPLVLFLDADDLFLPPAVEELVECIRIAGAQCGAVFARAERFQAAPGEPRRSMDSGPPTEDVEPYMARRLSKDLFALSRTVCCRQMKSSLVPVCAGLVRRQVYDDVGYWDEKLSSVEDREMWVRITAHTDTAFYNHTVALVRRHAGNRSQGNHWIKNHQNIMRLLVKIRDCNDYDDDLRSHARKQLGTEAYRLSGRLITEGDYGEANRTIRESLAVRPLHLKSWIRYAQCLALSPFDRSVRPDTPS